MQYEDFIFLATVLDANEQELSITLACPILVSRIVTGKNPATNIAHSLNVGESTLKTE